ncbi:PHA/PHB synthase family protein [Tardiphaga sp. 71_E8_N1_1]|uniref:PHA/PHB synthase family protein n=1 Tax=Tardiphaga sp. 71_E8_N1_1 TaxID=3240784 RepID=UPI003F8C7227
MPERPHSIAKANTSAIAPSAADAWSPDATGGAALDRSLHAAIAAATGGLSPAALALSFTDLALHLAASPGRQIELWANAVQDAARFCAMASRPLAQFRPWQLLSPPANDRRFAGGDWLLPAFNLNAQAFLLCERWWRSTTDLHGLATGDAAIAAFALRQMLDAVAPTNFPTTNPKVIRRALESGGMSFVNGFENWFADAWRLAGGAGASRDGFVIGKDVATAKGRVVFRNHLIELIQYEPTTATVKPEPLLIVPAWIMKYYILDLSPGNSLVRYLTGQGFTVFMISWRNPTSEDRNLSLEDYRLLGVEAALSEIQSIIPGRAVHGVGYCLGGTLLAIAVAAASPERRAVWRTLTMLAAQTDFNEAGELTLFINESQVAFLEDMMREKGVLGSQQMAGAFSMLRSNDLIWSRIVRHYLLGERTSPSDLMAWNADATRMPARMHSEYLRSLFLQNDLAEGRYIAGGRPIALSDLQTPMFVVGTREDHVAPWRSVYKVHYLTDAAVTFVLTSGGHNAGILAPPDEAGHRYQIMSRTADDTYLGPDEWERLAPIAEGSWWEALTAFLATHSGGLVESPAYPAIAEPLPEAPGSYVHQE